MDTRTDDFVGEVQVRSDDNEEIKSVELLAHEFRVSDVTEQVKFADDETRDRILGQMEAAVFQIVWHEVRPPVASKSAG